MVNIQESAAGIQTCGFLLQRYTANQQDSVAQTNSSWKRLNSLFMVSLYTVAVDVSIVHPTHSQTHEWADEGKWWGATQCWIHTFISACYRSYLSCDCLWMFSLSIWNLKAATPLSETNFGHRRQIKTHWLWLLIISWLFFSELLLNNCKLSAVCHIFLLPWEITLNPPAPTKKW